MTKQYQQKIHKDIVQGSEEWFELKKLRLTASHAQAIGSAGKGLDTLVTEMMASHYSSADRSSFTNKDLERGVELEPIAREMYELETGSKVEQVGFIEGGEYIGCSPDGLVGEDGGTEIKCLNDKEHYIIVRDGLKAVDSGYLWQVQMNLLITGRKWWDIIFYNPNSTLKTLVVFRILPDSIKMQSLELGIEKGIELIKLQLK